MVMGFLDLDLGANRKAPRTPGEEHDGFPDDSAYWPAVPCEMHTPGPRQTLPSALCPGLCQGHAPLGTHPSTRGGDGVEMGWRWGGDGAEVGWR